MTGFLNLWWPQLGLTELERRTFRRHLTAVLFEGAYQGSIVMAAYVLRKGLNASDFQVALLFSLQMAIFMFSSLVASYITRDNHRTFILLTGLFGRLSLVTVLFLPESYFIIGILTWVSLNHSIFIPSLNVMFRLNYRKETRGVCYARAQMAMLAISSTTAFLVGKVLNWRADLFPLVFAAAGIFGCATYLTYVTVPRPVHPLGKFIRPKRPPYHDFFSVLKNDRFFRWYEGNFFLYGIAFMITFAMVPIFVNDIIQADWSQASRMFGTIHPLVMILFLPIYGRLLDRTSVVPVASIAFFCLSFWPLILSMASTLNAAYAAYFFMGLGMAGVDVAWMLGAHTFADPDRIQVYSAIHVTLVGIRALFAPFLGLFIKRNFGFSAAFGIAAGLLILASVLMFVLGRRCERERCGGRIDE